MTSETSKFKELESKCETLYTLFYGGVSVGKRGEDAESILMRSSSILASILGEPRNTDATLKELLACVHAQLMSIRDCVMGVTLRSSGGNHETVEPIGVDALMHEADVTICFLRQRSARDSNCVLS